MRQATGELMARSKREIPHYYLAQTVDLAAAIEWLTRQNEHRSPAERVLPAALLLKATAVAARRNPNVNGFFVDGFQPAAAVHLGVAISLRGGGLVAPAIHDADGRSLDDLMADLRDLVERARAGRLRASEMADPTITVTNLGDQGADEVLGVIYPPQVALVGFGRVVDRPWAANGMLGVHPTIRATLAADHRVTDGHEGSRFLAAIAALLQAPEEL
jgi:pyruvate dehydrogenase E2 component (dihydrolipoamide acetyltransferase)